MASHCFRLTAPKNLGKIPKGYEIQVPTNQLSHPTMEEIREVLKRLGWSDYDAGSHASPGNWDVEKIS